MTTTPSHRPSELNPPRPVGLLVISWLVVGVPLLAGVYLTILKSTALFS